MATTDARTGFRLPWSTDQRQPTDDTAAAVADTAEPDSDAPPAQADAAPEHETAEAMAEPTVDPTPATDAPPETHEPVEAQADAVPVGNAPAAPAPSSPAKRPNKFLADLTRAMQAAAESAREETLTRFAAEAKTFVEGIHARSGEGAAELRQRADDEIAGIRDWSKAEIARIREETDRKITSRKADLEEELEAHAARIERQIDRIQGRVAEFEAEMARFFERLLAEGDPTRFAAMAESLPEPPAFEHDGSWVAVDSDPAPQPAQAVAVAAPVEVPVEPVADPWADAPWSTEPPENPEAAFAAIQAAAEAAERAETVAEYAAEASASSEAEVVAEAVESGTDDADPRLAALGLAPDYAAAAEAEAAVEADAGAAGEEIPLIDDDALAARLAGLVPSEVPDAPAADSQSTQVVVVGLVSVASIASFKRHLGRIAGVQSVGVSSGPDGEFVFAVTHSADVVLSDIIPALPGFQARVNGTSEGVVTVTAHDPESDAQA